MTEPWRDIISGQVRERSGRRQKNPFQNRTIGLNLTEQQWKTIDAAARARGISLAGFVRRSALAVAAHDLDVDAFEGERAPRGYDDKGGPTDPEHAEGKGFGWWKIVGMY